MNEGSGKHAGARRAEPTAASGPRGASRIGAPLKLLLLALGTTLSVVAWGYLVWAAIDFGRTARAGDATAWLYLVIASLGAIACLFAGLLLVVRLLRVLKAPTPGPTAGPTAGPGTGPATPPPPGGRRAKR